jgi:hypothetical protein
MQQLSTKVATHKMLIETSDKTILTVIITGDQFSKIYPVWSNKDHTDYKKPISFNSWTGHFWDIKEIIDLEKQRQERERGYSKYTNADWNTTYSEEDKKDVAILKEEIRTIIRINDGLEHYSNQPIFEKANDIRRKDNKPIPVYSFMREIH